MSSPKFRLSPAALGLALGLTLAMGASHAFADDCSDGQEDVVGKAVAASAAAKIGAVVTGTGKQMINLEVCEAQGATSAYAEFKYNVIGADGLYWAQGKAKVAGNAVKELTFTQLSPNLASASSAKGVKLAAN